MKLRAVGGAASLFAIAAIAWGWLSAEWAPERERAIAGALGWVTCTWLIATLAATLMKKARPWRRALGITTACLALVHVVASLVGPLAQGWSVAWTWPRYRAGVVAFAILVVLFTTSFPKKFRVSEWKALHRLVYVAAALVALHVVKLGSALMAIAVPMLIVVLLAARLRIRRRARDPADS